MDACLLGRGFFQADFDSEDATSCGHQPTIHFLSTKETYFLTTGMFPSPFNFKSSPDILEVVGLIGSEFWQVLEVPALLEMLATTAATITAGFNGVPRVTVLVSDTSITDDHVMPQGPNGYLFWQLMKIASAPDQCHVCCQQGHIAKDRQEPEVTLEDGAQPHLQLHPHPTLYNDG